MDKFLSNNICVGLMFMEIHHFELCMYVKGLIIVTVLFYIILISFYHDNDLCTLGIKSVNSHSAYKYIWFFWCSHKTIKSYLVLTIWYRYWQSCTLDYNIMLCMYWTWTIKICIRLDSKVMKYISNTIMYHMETNHRHIMYHLQGNFTLVASIHYKHWYFYTICK